MSYHYHEATCPHCGKIHRRSCSLNNCTTALVSLKPFASSDGHEAELAICYAVTRGANFYIDFGDRPAHPGSAPAEPRAQPKEAK